MVFVHEFHLKLYLPARYFMLWIQLRANCLPISARLIKYCKERCSNEDRYTCPLFRSKEDYLVYCLSRCQELSTTREGIFGKKCVDTSSYLKQYIASVYLSNSKLSGFFFNKKNHIKNSV